MKFSDDYKNLIVWQNSINLCVSIYEILEKFPEIEKYSLSNQMRRAAISIPSNIAEGMGRSYEKDTLKFLYISKGSLFELETQIIICQKVKYLNEEIVSQLLLKIDEIKKMLNNLIKYRSKNL